MEIFLIGSVHHSNSNFSDIDLLSILNTIKPDVIFEEWPVDNPPYNKEISEKYFKTSKTTPFCIGTQKRKKHTSVRGAYKNLYRCGRNCFRFMCG